MMPLPPDSVYARMIGFRLKKVAARLRLPTCRCDREIDDPPVGRKPATNALVNVASPNPSGLRRLVLNFRAFLFRAARRILQTSPWRTA
jgi:hypothetical protein